VLGTGELSFPAERLDATELLGERAVPRLEHRGEAEVLLRVLVAAVDAGIVGQRGEPTERRIISAASPFEEPAAPAREERVAREDGARPGKVVGDVSARVRRDHR
jgi:hypothetical protein